MVRLGHGDYELLLQAVARLGSAPDPDQFSRQAIAEVSRMVPGDVVTINEVDPAQDRVAYHMLPWDFPVPTGAAEALVRLADRHPLIDHYRTTGDGSARSISDFWDEETFHGSELYRCVYRPMGIEYQMSIGVSAPAPAVVGIAVNRSDSDFSRRNRLMLDSFRPHLAQGWRNAQEQARLRMLLDAVGGATSTGGDRGGVIVLSDPLEEITPGSLTQLYRYFGRPSPTGPMPGMVERWVDAQRNRLADADAPRLLRPLSARLNDRRLVLRYLPAQRFHPGALLVREERRPIRQRELEGFGFSSREEQVVRLLVTGASTSVIATELGISMGTVKKHLENVYQKTGVHGRGPLTAYVLDLAPG